MHVVGWTLLQTSVVEAWTTNHFGNLPPHARRNVGCWEQVRIIQSVLASHQKTVNQEGTSPPLWPTQPRLHIVNGVECREITIDLPVVGSVTILEATAKAQNALVDLALTMDDDIIIEDENHNPPSMSFQIDTKTENIQLNVGDPYGAVLWPASSAVATRLLQLNGGAELDVTSSAVMDISRDKMPLQGLTIVELGAGTGLVSLAALKAGAGKVVAVDYELLPLQLLQYATEQLNPGGCQENRSALQYMVLDLEADFTPHCQALLDQADILVAADVLYQPSTGKALAKWIVQFLQSSSAIEPKRVLIGDSPGRPGRPVLLQELQRLGISNASFYDTVGRTCSGPRHELICGPDSQSVSQSPRDLDVAILELTSTSRWV